MQDENQYRQLIMQYEQLKNGALEISRMIDAENYDNAITMIKNRESVFLNCKCMRNYLDLTPVQQKELDGLIDELRDIEMLNIKKLEKGMQEVQQELIKTQRTEKLQNAYGTNTSEQGSIVNYEE